MDSNADGDCDEICVRVGTLTDILDTASKGLATCWEEGKGRQAGVPCYIFKNHFGIENQP